MSHERAPAPGEPTSQGLRYIHGASAVEQTRLARRTAAASAAFLLPHLRPGRRLLDVGCGVGSITVGLAEAVAPGEVVGLDFQPAQVERARALAEDVGTKNIGFAVGTAYALPFPDASFDAAFANALLAHLADPQRALRELKRVLKPGGVAGVADDDQSTLIWEPRTPLLTDAHRLLLRVAVHHGADPYRARRHRQLLREAGFARVVGGANFGTLGVWGTPEETRTIAAWWADQLRAPAFARLVTEQGWADETALEAMVAETLTWGDHPDAFFAAMTVTAVGWVDG